MDKSTQKVLLFSIISAIAYTIPILWIKGSTTLTACISSLFALITLGIYALFIKNHTIDEIDTSTFYRMAFSGIFYGIGLLLYIEAVKYNKMALLNTQTVLIFILSSIIALTILNEQPNSLKILGIIIATIGSGLLVCGH